MRIWIRRKMRYFQIYYGLLSFALFADFTIDRIFKKKKKIDRKK